MADKVAGLVIKVESKGAKTASDRLKALTQNATIAEKALMQLTARAARADKTFDAFGASVKQALPGLRSTSSASRSLNTALRSTASAAGKARNSLSGVGAGATRATGSFNKTERSARGAADSLRRVQPAADRTSRSVRSMGRNVNVTAEGMRGIIDRSLAATAGFVALNKAVDALRFTFRVTADFERLGKQLEFVTGSAQGTANTIDFLRQRAEATGQRFLELAPAYGKLEFAFKQTGLSASDARETFKGVTAAAATFGLAQSDVNGILRAFVQVASKGKVQAEELRGQIGERVPGAFGLAAESIGLTTAELSKQLELGNVMAKDLLPSLARALNETFGEDLTSKTDTLINDVNRLKSELDDLALSLNASGVFSDFLTGLRLEVKALRVVVDTLSRGGIEEAADRANSRGFTGAPADFTSEQIRDTLVLLELRKEDLETQGKLNRAQRQQARTISQSIDALEEQLSLTRAQERSEQVTAAIQKKRQSDFNALIFETRALLGEPLDLFGNPVEAFSKQLEELQLRGTRDIFGRVASDFADVFAAEAVEPSINLFAEDLSKAITDKPSEAFKKVTLGFQQELSKSGLQEALANIFDFSNVSQGVGGSAGTSGIEKSFEALRSASLTAQEKRAEDYRQNLKTLEEYEKAFGDDVVAITERVRQRLKVQYQKDEEAYKEAQRRKALETSDTFNAIIDITQGIEDALVNAATEGQVAFKDMARFILAEIQRIYIRSLLLRPLYGALGSALPGVAGAGFAAAANNISPPSAIGGRIPAGNIGVVGEEGPEIVRGPTVVTSTRSTASMMEERSSKPTKTNVVNITMGGGVSPQEFGQLQQIVSQLNASVEVRSLAAFREAHSRTPGFISR